MADSEKRGPGRPPQLAPDERRHRILDAAEAVFRDEGYEAATMDRVAHRCGMSKKTLYRVFESKEALFAALLDDSDSAGHTDDAVSAEDALVARLTHMALWILSPRQIGMTRLTIAEATRLPDLAARFRAQATNRGRGGLVRLLADRGVALPPGFDDTEELVSTLFGIAIGNLQLRALAGEDIAERSTPERLERRIRSAVRALLFAS
jgi:AcrR family transcriptional regulator